MTRLFGTDGIRAAAYTPPLDRETVQALGGALIRRLEENGRPPHVLLGGDTRASTPDLAHWLSNGIFSAGGRISWAGVLPTPAISRLLRDGDWGAGVVISASHNPAGDNGIKILDHNGAKIDVGEEDRLESGISSGLKVSETGMPEPDDSLYRKYRDLLLSSLPEARHPRNFHLVVDAAHGAASGIAEEVLRELGFTVTGIASSPNGNNINDGVGATAPETLAREVLRLGANAGLALDGDADRAILVDENGMILDGDDILLIWARALLRRNQLPGKRIVATVMSNFGLEAALKKEGIEVVRCPVGDRSVWEKMQEMGSVLGGEQSGHIICSHFGLSGDGLLTGIQILAECRERPLSSLSGLRRLPQILLNIPVAERLPFEEIPGLLEARNAAADRIEGRGRILLRYSGTELLARVMVEGEDEREIHQIADELAGIIRV